MRFIALILASLLSSAPLFAYDFCEENNDGIMIFYNILQEGYCEVAESPESTPEQYSGDIVVPEYTSRGIVVGVGVTAFYNCQTLKSVELPNTVRYLDSGSFAYCPLLTSVDMGNNVWAIGESVFEGCGNLSSVNIPESLEYSGYFAFYGCSSISEPLYNSHLFVYYPELRTGHYSIPEGIKTIGISAFSFSKIESVEIPTSVTTISDNAFDASNLTGIDIPLSVTTLGHRALGQCIYMTSVTIPKSVVNFGTDMFWASTSLKEIILENDLESIPDGTFESCLDLEEVTMPESVKSIGEYAFWNCLSLKSLRMPEYLDSIGQYAFYRCESLTSLHVPHGVEVLEDGTFSMCKKLRTVSLPSTLKTIKMDVFYDCKSIETFVFPESVETIETTAFSSIGAKEVYAPWSVPVELGNPWDQRVQFPCGETLHVPIGTADIYANAPVWKYFPNIIEEDMTGIKEPEVLSKDKLQGDAPIYDLHGRQHELFQRGVNIVGGKKIMVRVSGQVR